jgi:hypothetical protein
VPIPKFYGDRPTITGDRQVASQPGSKAAQPPIQSGRWFRNPRHPDANVFSQMCAGVNAGMVFRTKEIFSCGQVLGASAGIGLSSTALSRKRWRFAFHASPFHFSLFCSAIMYPQSTGYNADAYATLKVYSDATETTLVGSTEFHYGANPLQSASITGWQHLREINRFIEGLTPNTTYYAVVADESYGLIQSLCVADIQSATQGNNGYLPTTFTTESMLLDEYRSNVVEPLADLWNRGGAKVCNWTVDSQSSPRTNATMTQTNIIDGSSTTYGTSVPGVTLCMTGKAWLSQSSGVPCKVFAYLDSTSANNGQIVVRNEAATVSTTVDYLGLANTPQWFSSTINLPATSGKYYITSAQTAAASTIKVHAVSIIEYL